MVTNGPRPQWLEQPGVLPCALMFLVGLQSSAPHPLPARTRADAEQPHRAEEEALMPRAMALQASALTWSP